MGSALLMKRAAMGIALAAGLCAATPAVAGRCGHSYAVDAPTTLSKVARACNVSYAALLEANRGVDPGNVRPGQHLAIPDEVADASEIAAPASDAAADKPSQIAHPYISARPESAYSTYFDGGAGVQPVNARAPSASATYFDSIGMPIHARSSRLSYQKLSAARIRNAGIARVPIVIAPTPLNRAGVAETVSAYPTPLMECAVLRRQADGKIRQVREVKPAPEGVQPPAHCVAFESAAPDGAILTRGAERAHGGEENLMLFRGFVSHVSEECVTLEADDGSIWRLGAPDSAGELLGKDATVWATAADSRLCDGLVLDHAVYAERLYGR